MKKDVLKGIIIGSLATLAFGITLPVIAETVKDNILLNPFRIKSSNKTLVNWGQDYTL